MTGRPARAGADRVVGRRVQMEPHPAVFVSEASTCPLARELEGQLRPLRWAWQLPDSVARLWDCPRFG